MNKVEGLKIYYFSGTGNAKKIAEWISLFANRENIVCDVINIAKIDINSLKAPNPDLLIVLISPIHGFNYPKIVLRFIKNFPKGKNNVILMNTRAGMKIGKFVTPGLTGIAFMVSSLMLKIKGYSIKGHIPFDMPSNWISIHPALKEEPIKFIFKKNYERLEKHCNKIFFGKTDYYSNRDLIQDILISPVSFLYYLAGRFIFAKSYYASSDCDNCGLCIKNCPVNSIKQVYDRPYWTFNCESCMKCMNSCPKNAIETAHGLFAIIGLAGPIVTTYIFFTLLGINVQNWFLRLGFYTIVFFIILWLFYRIQQLLLKNKFISRVIVWTSLTQYKFWGRYKIISDDKWK
jgi:ferredoxin